jgi:hypothetical protein
LGNYLIVSTEAPYCLNFLVYLQNAYYNSRNLENQSKFPYVFSNWSFVAEEQLLEMQWMKKKFI